MFSDIISLLILILLSAFFSGSEMAYVLSNKIKLELRARTNRFGAKQAHFFAHNPENLFSTLLVGNNIANIAYASLSAILLKTFFAFNEWEILFISTFILLIFGELLPKYFAREIPDAFFMFVAIPLRFISLILSPINRLTEAITKKLTATKNLSQETISNLFDRDDLDMLVKESQDAGIVNKQDSEIIRKVFDLKEQNVSEAMRPRTEIVGVELESSMDEVIQSFIESGYSKIIVYEENMDNIKGVVLAYDLFKEPSSLKILVREILFVPESKKSLDMLNDFLEKGVSIAVVVDEFGGTSGIVTTEDIIEELFGEIKDEYDIDENIMRKIDDNTYLVSGKVEIDLLNDEFKLDLPIGDYETIAGFITANSGLIPSQGEIVQFDRYTFHILRSNQRKIELAKLTISRI